MSFQDAVMDVEDAVLSDALVGAEVEEVGESIGENRYESEPLILTEDMGPV